jgi:hypothetical protein
MRTCPKDAYINILSIQFAKVGARLQIGRFYPTRNTQCLSYKDEQGFAVWGINALYCKNNEKYINPTYEQISPFLVIITVDYPLMEQRGKCKVKLNSFISVMACSK